MEYLCSKHRQELVSKPENDISQYWLDWMINAGEYYDARNWQRAKLFAGSALDLSSAALNRSDISKTSMLIHATLAGIYVANIANHLFDKATAIRKVIGLQTKFKKAGLNSSERKWANTCLMALSTRERQWSFFNEYLSLPLSATSEYSDMKEYARYH